MKVGLIGFVVGFAVVMGLFWYAGVDFGHRSGAAAAATAISLLAGFIAAGVADEAKKGRI